MPRPPRSRSLLLLGILLIIPIGLLARHARDAYPGPLTAYNGDTLWPMLFYMLFAIALPAVRGGVLAVLALAATVAIEFLKLYHGPWIDAVRSTRIGVLLLGNTFLISHLACLVAGTTLALLLDLRAGSASRAKALRHG
jgi:hypothetical protein